MARQKPTVTHEMPDQRCVVVRVDIVIYILVVVIAILALASVAWPERVELALIGTLCTALAGMLGGWLTFVRMARRADDKDGMQGGDSDAVGHEADTPDSCE